MKNTDHAHKFAFTVICAFHMTLTKTTHLHSMFMDWPTTPLATLRRATVPALETMRARSRYRLNQRNCSIVLPECLRDKLDNATVVRTQDASISASVSEAESPSVSTNEPATELTANGATGEPANCDHGIQKYSQHECDTFADCFPGHTCVIMLVGPRGDFRRRC